MANRVPLIADSSTLFLKELPSGDALDLTGCSIVGLTSFTPGTGGGYGFIGITTFGDGTGAATTGVYVNDGLLANYLKASNLTADRVVLTGAGGTLTDSSDLTFSASTLTAANVTITGDTNLGNASGDTITATGKFDSSLIPASDSVNLGSSTDEWGDLYIDGTANIDALVADSAKISDLTDNRVVIAGSAGELEDSGNLTFDGSTLTVTGDLAVSGNLNYTNVTDIYSVGIITAAANVQVGAGISVVGVSTFINQVNIVDVKHTGIGTFNDVKVGGGLTVTGAADLNGALDVDGQTDLDVLNVSDVATFSADVNLIGGGSGISSAFWDQSAASLKFKDDALAEFGDSQDLTIYHTGGHTWLKNDTGYLRFATDASGFTFSNIDNSTAIAQFVKGGKCELYWNGNLRLGTDSHGAFITGIATVSSTSHMRIPVGNTSQRPGDSIAVDGDIRYNTTIKGYEGYSDGAWGGLGGGTEIDNIIETASATGVGTFAKADYRAASIRAQINQDGNYQVGRYLLIHDDTTVTMVEEAAIATGSMLGTFDGVINGSNIELKVTMGSAGIATVTAIIDKISV